jgi:predicted nucleotidyltransferase
MDKDAVIATLKAHRADLERKGVIHAALFGSVARGEAGPESDIDSAIEMDYDVVGGWWEYSALLWEYSALKQQIADLFSSPVDVVNQRTLKPGIRESVARDVIYAF